VSDPSSRFVGNTLYVLVARGIELATGVLVVGLATHYLSTTEFGAYSFIASTALILSSFIAMGCSRILIRDVAVDAGRAGSLTVSALFANIVFGLFACIAMGLVLWGTQMRSTPALVAGLAAIAAQTVLVLRQTVGAVAIAREVMQYEALFAAVSRGLLVCGVIVVVTARLAYPYLFVAAAVAHGVGLVVAWSVVFRRLASPAWGIRGKEIRYLLGESVPVAAYNFLGQTLSYVNVFLLKWFHDLSHVALFQAPMRIIGPLMILPMTLLFAFTPAIARLGADASRHKELARSYMTALRYILVAVFPAAVAVSVYAGRLVGLLFGTDYLGASATFRVLFWGIIPFSFSALLNVILTSLGKQRAVVVAHVASLVLAVAVGLWLVPRFAHVGAAVAFLGSTACLFLMNHCLLTRTVGGISLSPAVLRPVLACLLLAVVMERLARVLPAVPTVLVAWAGYLAVLPVLRVVSPAEVRACVRLVQGVFRR